MSISVVGIFWQIYIEIIECRDSYRNKDDL